MALQTMLDNFPLILQALEEVISLRQTEPEKLSDICPLNGPVFRSLLNST